MTKIVLSFISVFFCSTLLAQNQSEIDLQHFNQRLTLLEKKLRQPKHTHKVSSLTKYDDTPPLPTLLTQLEKQTFVLQSPDGQNQLRFFGILQTDQDIFMNTRGLTINNGISSSPIVNGNTVDRIWMRSVSPMIFGRILHYTDFFINTDFGQGQVRLYDAFMQFHYLDWLSLNVGKQMSLLVGLDTLKPTEDSFSMEEAYSSMMAPNREIGFMFHGGFEQPGHASTPVYRGGYSFFTDYFFSYQLGVFSGTADNTNPGLNPVTATEFSTETFTLENKGLELRFFTNPFINSNINILKGLGFGLAAGVDNPNNDTGLPSMISVGQNVIFSYIQDIAANHTRRRIHPQAYWFAGPLGAMMEWTQTKQSLSNQIEPAPPGQLNQFVTQYNHAGQIEFIYNITGEPMSFHDLLVPDHPFKPWSKNSWGALQGVGRVTWLNMDRSVFQDSTILDDQTLFTFADPRLSVQHADTWSIGLNWYLNQNIKITTEYDQTRFIGGCSTGAMSAAFHPGCLTSGTAATASSSQVTNRPDEQVIMQRVQLWF